MSEFAKRRIWGPEPRYPLVEAYENRETNLISIAGPCSIENRDQIEVIAKDLGRIGVKYMRGGVFRAGTYPGEDFGLIGEDLIDFFHEAAHNYLLDVVLEVLDYSDDALEIYQRYADVFQVGARQMQNYNLLKILAGLEKPIFLKRNMGSNLHEWLGAAEYLLKNGAEEIALIERGSSTFMNHVRWDLSISIIPAVKKITQIPVIIDASHGTGRRDLVEPMLYAGIAAGADGFLIETHPTPEKSLSDADQAVPLEDMGAIMANVINLRSLISKF